MVVTLYLDAGFRPVDLEFPTTLRTLVCLGALGERRASPTVGTDAVRSPKVRRRLPIVLRAFHDAPALRRSLLDLEPRPEHAKAAVGYFDNCLGGIEVEDAGPRPPAELGAGNLFHAGQKKPHQPPLWGG